MSRKPFRSLYLVSFFINSVARIQIAQHLQPRMGYALGEYVHVERLVPYAPELPHFVEKRIPPVPKLQLRMEQQMLIVRYANIFYYFSGLLTFNNFH